MLAMWAPWVVLVVALAATFARTKKPVEDTEPSKVGRAAHSAGGICIAIGVIAMVLGMAYKSSLPGIDHAGMGALFGSVLAVLCGFLGSRFDSSHANYAAPVSFGAFAIAVSYLFPEGSRQMVQFGSVFGLAAGSWVLSIAPTHWPAIASCVSGAVGASAWMGGFGYGDRAPMSGIALAVSLSLIAVIVEFAFPKKEGKADARLVATTVLFVGMGWLVASKFLFMGDAWRLVALGAVAALVVAWMVPKDNTESSFPVAISMLIWLAVATIAFAMRRGYGMSICLMAATGILAISGNGRALLTLGPLAALCVYRVLREMHPDAAKAFDIGQHYGLMGLLIGASVVLIAIEWRRSVEPRNDLKVAVASGAWAPIFGILPTVSAIVIAAKGFVGVVAGVGIGTAIAALKGETKPHALALQTGASAALAMQYGWLTEKLDLTRDDKVKSLIGFSVALILLGALIAWFSRPSSQSAEQE